jgi:hypothetical protein
MIKMKTLISGLRGVIVACLIFTAVVISPWSKSLSGTTSPTIPPEWQNLPAPPITISLALYNFTEPRGLGSQANLTITVISNTTLPDVVIEIDISKGQFGWNSTGIEFIEGQTLWIGNLTSDMPITWTIRINASEVGYGIIKVAARWSNYWDYRLPDRSLGIVVLEDEIQVIEPLNLNALESLVPPVFPPGFNPPTFPNPINMNQTMLYP